MKEWATSLWGAGTFAGLVLWLAAIAFIVYGVDAP